MIMLAQLEGGLRWYIGGDAHNMCKEMTTHIRKVTIEVFGVTR
jgi:hypothetical protein